MGGPRILASLLILLLLTSFLSGCWDRRELEEQAFVLTIGIDKGPIPSSFLWTFQIAVPRQLAGGQTAGGGGGGAQQPSTIISIESTTIFGALNLINSFLLVAEGKAKDTIAAYKPILEQNPAKFIETLVLNSSYTDLMPKTQLHDYLTHAESKAIEATAILVGK
ncbi:MAG: hypothetical protein M0Z31_12735 [Clostridia bacterium]|nr:hypothetical protein [Clostridia bacterium]